MSKIFIENPTGQMKAMFEDWGHTVVALHTDADLIVFEGGTDVSPALYGEAKGDRTQTPDTVRDMHCVFLWNYAVNNNIPVVGVCRGAQFITVMQGGKLVQHMDYHKNPVHKVFFDPAACDSTEPESMEMEVTSDHHQAMLPVEDYYIMAKSEDDVVEITYYDEHNHRQLAVQGHPEWTDKKHEFQKWFMEFINEWML